MIPDNRQEIEKELKHLAPSLGQLSKQNYTDVPTGYFEKLPDQVWKKLSDSNPQGSLGRKPLIRFLSKHYLTVAASLILAVAAIFVLKPFSETKEELPLSADELFAYIYMHPEDLDDEILYGLLESEGLENFALAMDEDVLDYYLEENFEEFDDSLLEDLF